ncbi:MAG: RidA family protein [Thermoplasmata archaeon]
MKNMIERIVLSPYDQYELSTFVTQDNVVYIGHIGGVTDEGGNLLSTTKEQMEQTLKNLDEYLNEIDLCLKDVVKLTVIMKDIDDFRDMHEVWKEHFDEGKYPVRSVITSNFVNENIMVQVEGIACSDQ